MNILRLKMASGMNASEGSEGFFFKKQKPLKLRGQKTKSSAFFGVSQNIVRPL